MEQSYFLPAIKFIWEPYCDDLIGSLPDFCRLGRDLWRARVTIFCWDGVEVHLPDRVVRQFGFMQRIPDHFQFDVLHFHHDRRGRKNKHWDQEHAQWLPFWNQRHQYVYNAPVSQGPLQFDDIYLIWFRRITHLLIGNPTHRPQRHQGYVPNSTAYEAMVQHIHLMVDSAKSLGDQPTYEDLYMFRAMVRDQGYSCLAYVHEADRIQIPVDYRRDTIQTEHLHHPVHRRGKGGVACRRVRAVERGREPAARMEAAGNIR